MDPTYQWQEIGGARHHVKSEEGELTFPEGCTLFVPGLAGTTRKIVLSWFRNNGYGEIAEAAEMFGAVNYYRNWFIPTVSAFKAMAVCGGFELVDEGAVGTDNCAYTLLLKPAAASS